MEVMVRSAGILASHDRGYVWCLAISRAIRPKRVHREEGLKELCHPLASSTELRILRFVIEVWK